MTVFRRTDAFEGTVFPKFFNLHLDSAFRTVRFFGDFLQSYFRIGFYQFEDLYRSFSQFLPKNFKAYLNDFRTLMT